MSLKAASLKICLLAASLCLASGCATRESGTALAEKEGWNQEILHARAFDIAAAWPGSRIGQSLWIYIEGDGRAFLSPTEVSQDPTPTDPVGLRMALAHPTWNPVAYIGRPCQYVDKDHRRNCKPAYWTNERYAPEVVDSTDAAIDLLKQKTGTSRIVLVGYSGGGALAVLVAATRHDVIGIATVSADLDTVYWTKHNGLTPLTGSLNPADYTNAVMVIPQIHFTGGKDENVGPDVVRAYASRMPADAPVRVVEMPDFDHNCCWVRDWPSLALQAKNWISTRNPSAFAE